QGLIVVLSSWVIPGSDRMALLPGQNLLTAVILFLTLAGLLAASVKLLAQAIRTGGISSLSLRLSRTPIVFGLFALVYTALLFAMIAFVIPPPWFDNRLLSPVYVAALICVIFLFHKLFKASEHGSLRVILSLIGVGLVGMYAVVGGA